MSHEVTHWEKPYKCDLCDKDFYNNSDLRKHMKTHTGEKPHLCSQCGKTFYRKTELIIPSENTFWEKPYECSYCGKAFIKNSSLISHLRTHTGRNRMLLQNFTFLSHTWLLNMRYIVV
ncbi:unnamed protein product [Meganyctiphanes norvegica]|uniref:C2H2-type domain-containing protein n=1 Tax=Meganyctiphanes norvegica TaxID=48144 RepID=A0AAV2SR37_MEGNR